jgi:iron complex transport system substrate-binding protein
MSRRQRFQATLGVLALVVGALTMAACGGGGDAAASPPSPARSVTHALGSTTVPAQPARIVVLNQYSLLDYLLAVGIRPVGSTGDPAASDPFARHLAGRTEGIEMVGGAEAPNLEHIAALTPDLILANPWQEDVYDELSQIAPTVAVPLSYANYEEEYRYVARLVGREAEAAQLIEAHRGRLAAFRRAAAERLAGLEVAVARIFPDEIRVEGDSYVTRLMDAAGLRRPAPHRAADGLTLSPERLPEIDADALIVYSAANAAAEADNARARERLARNPLWHNLRAVRAGRVHVVDSFIWAGGGMLWADRVLEDLSRLLLGRTS